MSKETFVRTFIEEVWNRQEFDKIEKYIHKAYTIHLDAEDPWEGKTLSHEEFKTRMKYSFDSFPDLHFEITSVTNGEDQVAINWILTGTNSGMIGKFEATNKPIETTGLTIYHFKDNLINGHTQVYDRKTVMRQLGFIQ